MFFRLEHTYHLNLQLAICTVSLWEPKHIKIDTRHKEIKCSYENIVIPRPYNYVIMRVLSK